MNHRNSNRGRDRDDRAWRASEPRPERDEHGLHGHERSEYRGRESYEQQTRGGEGGRSGMFPERRIATDMHDRYRSNADEDARGYQNIARRTEFVSADRDRPDYGRYARPNDRDYDEARYGLGDRSRGQSARGDDYDDDYSHTDYGSRDYHRPSFEPSERFGREYEPYPGASQRTPHGPEFGYGRPAVRAVSRGPRGYKRSDERVREEVCERLGRDWDVDASDVEVNVASGEVTLSGSVEDRRQKFRAEHLADGVWGVTEVHNQLRVKRERDASEAGKDQPSVRGSANHQNRSS